MKVIGLITFILILSSFIFAQETQKNDEFEYISCEDYLSKMFGLVNFLKENPNSKAYLLVYEGKETQYNFKKKKVETLRPAYGMAKIRIRSIQSRFVYLGENLLKQIVFVEAGFRENFMIEVWSVPLGAEPPKPTPTLKKMRYRKGKPQGFCYGCC